MDRKAGGNRRHRAGWMFAGAAVAVLCTSALRAEDRVVVKFAPPPTPFTNMVSHLAVESLDVDYMNMSMENMNLTSAVIGWSGTNRNFDRGGTYGALIGQFIYGSLDMGDMSEDADSIALYGPGLGLVGGFYYDFISEEADDNSLPVYFAVRFFGNTMEGSFPTKTTVVTQWTKFMGTWYPSDFEERKDDIDINMTNFNIGFQLGMQAGINAGPYFKLIPYVDFAKDVISSYIFSMRSSVYKSSTDPVADLDDRTWGYAIDSTDRVTKWNLPALFTPGFDVIVRPLGLSLGATYQTSKQGDTTIKILNLHFRYQWRFGSVCGA